MWWINAQWWWRPLALWYPRWQNLHFITTMLCSLRMCLFRLLCREYLLQQWVHLIPRDKEFVFFLLSRAGSSQLLVALLMLSLLPLLSSSGMASSSNTCCVSSITLSFSCMCFLSFLWVWTFNMCLCKFMLVVNIFLHWSHGKRIPSCAPLMCRFKLLNDE